MQTTSVAVLKTLGAELTEEKFEGIAEVAERETNLDQQFVSFGELVASKTPLFQDALEKQSFREKVELDVKVHADLCRQIQEWGAARATYLQTKEVIGSRKEAEVRTIWSRT